MSEFAVIDADGHVLETAGCDWERYLEAPFKHRAPQWAPFDTGGGRFYMEGHFWPQPYPIPRKVGGVEVPALHKGRRGMYEPALRLQHMDEDGIDVAVLFGGAVNVGASVLPDAAFAAAMCRAYNNWLYDFCAQDPRRLKGVAAVPLQDVPAAILEMRRAVSELGFVCVAVPPNMHGKNLDAPELDAFWAAAQALDVPIGVHMITNLWGMPGAADHRFLRQFHMHLTAFTFELMIASAAMITGGVFDRFPRLRAGFLEGGCGWVPFWFDRLNEHWEVLGDQVVNALEPMEYLKRGNCYFGLEPGEITLRQTLDLIGNDRILFASDYWHWDAAFPGAVKKVAERPELTATEKQRLLTANAQAFFRWPSS